MIEHTPETWEVKKGSKYAYVQIPEVILATVRIPLEDIADAYLMAAAPENASRGA